MKAFRNILNLLLFTVLLLLYVLTAISSRYPFLGKMGVVTWYASYGLFFVLALKNLGFILKNLTKKKFYLTCFMIVVLIGLVFAHLNDTKSVSFETANETNCMLTHLENAEDWGFNKTCLFGYPARQYLLSALPTLFFGRSLWSLHLGGSLYFILGLIIFSGGALRYFKDQRLGDIITATVLASILHVYYFNHFMFIYEQGIFPFSMALIAAGLLLDFDKKCSIQALLFLGVLNFYLIFSYTPGIVVFFLVLVILTSTLFKKRHTNLMEVFTIGMIICASLAVFFMSLHIRSDIHIRDANTSYIQLKGDLLTGAKHILWQQEGSPMMSPILNFVFLLTIFASVLFVFGWEGFVIGIWTICVIIFSIGSKGYWYYPINFRLHRAMVIFPFLFITLLKYFEHVELRSRKIRYALFVIYLFIFLTGISYHHKHIELRRDSRNNTIALWLAVNFPREYIGQKNRIYFDTPLAGPIDDSYSSQNDYITYFIHRSRSEALDPACAGLLNNNGENIFVFVSENEEKKDCYKSPSMRKTYLNSFTYKTEEPLKFYKIIFQ